MKSMLPTTGTIRYATAEHKATGREAIQTIRARSLGDSAIKSSVKESTLSAAPTDKERQAVAMLVAERNQRLAMMTGEEWAAIAAEERQEDQQGTHPAT